MKENSQNNPSQDHGQSSPNDFSFVKIRNEILKTGIPTVGTKDKGFRFVPNTDVMRSSSNFKLF